MGLERQQVCFPRSPSASRVSPIVRPSSYGVSGKAWVSANKPSNEPKGPGSSKPKKAVGASNLRPQPPYQGRISACQSQRVPQGCRPVPPLLIAIVVRRERLRAIPPLRTKTRMLRTMGVNPNRKSSSFHPASPRRQREVRKNNSLKMGRKKLSQAQRQPHPRPQQPHL